MCCALVLVWLIDEVIFLGMGGTGCTWTSRCSTVRRRRVLRLAMSHCARRRRTRRVRLRLSVSGWRCGLLVRERLISNTKNGAWTSFMLFCFFFPVRVPVNVQLVLINLIVVLLLHSLSSTTTYHVSRGSRCKSIRPNET